MKEKCFKTCGYCKKRPDEDENCFDAMYDCKPYTNYCKGFYMDEIEKMCQKTCGFCTVGKNGT